MVKYSKRLSDKIINGRRYMPLWIQYSKKEAEEHMADLKPRHPGCSLKILSWPKNVSTEDYGEGPGFAPTYIIYLAKPLKKPKPRRK